MRAYHWLKSDLSAGSGSEPAWTVGETRTYKGEIELCVRGYHSSPSWSEGLEYATGPVACVVEVSDPVQSDTTKQVSATRTLLAARDVTRELRVFACDCAQRALNRERDAGREPDARSWAAIEVARRYANGQATDLELAAARAAARDAARAAVWAAASAAVWDAARAAVWDAASAAARAAARDAERDWQRQHLAEMLDPLFVEGAT